MNVRDLDLVEYLAIAAEVTGLDKDGVSRIANLHLADSALHATAAGWGEDELYPDLVDKAAAVLVVRLTKTHALPDGNKRVALPSEASSSSTDGAGRSTRRRTTLNEP